MKRPRVKHEIVFRPGTTEIDREILTWTDPDGAAHRMDYFGEPSAETKRKVQHEILRREAEAAKSHKRFVPIHVDLPALPIPIDLRLAIIRDFCNSLLSHHQAA
jgi:hypothetical protein